MDVPVKCLLVQMPSSPHFPKARHGVSDLRSPVPAWALSRSSGDTQAKGEQGCGEHDPIVKSRLPLCLDTPHREMMGDTTKMRCQPRRDSAGPLVPTPTWLVPTGGFSETRGLLDTGLSPEPASNSREETAGAQDDAAQLPGSREAPSMRQAESLPRAPNSTPPQDAGPGKATPLFISRFPSMASRMRETVLETGRRMEGEGRGRRRPLPNWSLDTMGWPGGHRHYSAAQVPLLDSDISDSLEGRTEHPHSTDENAEAQTGEEASPRPHSGRGPAPEPRPASRRGPLRSVPCHGVGDWPDLTASRLPRNIQYLKVFYGPQRARDTLKCLLDGGRRRLCCSCSWSPTATRPFESRVSGFRCPQV
ncbi:uncharacterized protein LOC129052743 isoform X2 [Pongo abelii]|uniref:uncharacterized protein LOC129052743 isoform X2 n=1 Tax=Pongo abelii TaxID=9601 RepID=UPI003003DBEB